MPHVTITDHGEWLQLQFPYDGAVQSRLKDLWGLGAQGHFERSSGSWWVLATRRELTVGTFRSYGYTVSEVNAKGVKGKRHKPRSSLEDDLKAAERTRRQELREQKKQMKAEEAERHGAFKDETSVDHAQRLMASDGKLKRGVQALLNRGLKELKVEFEKRIKDVDEHIEAAYRKGYQRGKAAAGSAPTAAPPSNGSRSSNIWLDVFQQLPNQESVDRVYRAAAMGLHTDHGGSNEAMRDLNVAHDKVKKGAK